jgi:hypothetical protein
MQGGLIHPSAKKKMTTTSHMANSGVPNPIFMDLLEEITKKTTERKLLERFKDLCWQYKDVFLHPNDPTSVIKGNLRAKGHEIKIKPNTRPGHTRPMRGTPAVSQFMKAHTNKHIRDGLADYGTSEFVSPSFTVPKADVSMRPVIDYRKLNESTLPNTYPMITTQDILKATTGKPIFSKCDSANGYHQIPLRDLKDGKQESIDYTLSKQNQTSTDTIIIKPSHFLNSVRSDG